MLRPGVQVTRDGGRHELGVGLRRGLSCPRCGGDTTDAELTYRGCADCQAELAEYDREDATHPTLREQVEAIVTANTAHRGQHDIPKITSAVLALLADHDQQLRERIQTLQTLAPLYGDGADTARAVLADALATLAKTDNTPTPTPTPPPHPGTAP